MPSYIRRFSRDASCGLRNVRRVNQLYLESHRKVIFSMTKKGITKNYHLKEIIMCSIMEQGLLVAKISGGSAFESF